MPRTNAQKERQRANRKLKNYGLKLDRQADREQLAMRTLDDVNNVSRKIGKSTNQNSKEDKRHWNNSWFAYDNVNGTYDIRISEELGRSLDLHKFGFFYIPVVGIWTISQNAITIDMFESIVDTIAQLEGTYHVY